MELLMWNDMSRAGRIHQIGKEDARDHLKMATMHPNACFIAFQVYISWLTWSMGLLTASQPALTGI